MKVSPYFRVAWPRRRSNGGNVKRNLANEFRLARFGLNGSAGHQKPRSVRTTDLNARITATARPALADAQRSKHGTGLPRRRRIERRSPVGAVFGQIGRLYESEWGSVVLERVGVDVLFNRRDRATARNRAKVAADDRHCTP